MNEINDHYLQQSKKIPWVVTLFQAPFNADVFTAIGENGQAVFMSDGLPIYGTLEYWAEKDEIGLIRITEIQDVYHEMKTP